VRSTIELGCPADPEQKVDRDQRAAWIQRVLECMAGPDQGADGGPHSFGFH
jgi:hypothetical protein